MFAPSSEELGADRVAAALGRARSISLEHSIAELLDEVRGWGQGQRFQDDVSVLGIEVS